METRTRGHGRLAVLSILMSLLLCGCDDGYTIHSIYQASPGPSSVPDVAGLWQSSDAQWNDGVLQIAAEDYDVGHCRAADIRILDMKSNDDDWVIGDEMCFVPIAGHMIMQVRTTGEVRLYQDFLVKIDQDSITTCGSIWTQLMALNSDHPKQFSMEGLEYTIRAKDFGNEMIVTSSTDELRAYLEVNLPKIARTCDEGDEGDGQRQHWTRLKRLTPARPAEKAEDSPPSP
jgi:hypothetical protein